MLLPYHPPAHPMTGKVPACYPSSAAVGTQPRAGGHNRDLSPKDLVLILYSIHEFCQLGGKGGLGFLQIPRDLREMEGGRQGKKTNPENTRNLRNPNQPQQPLQKSHS